MPFFTFVTVTLAVLTVANGLTIQPEVLIDRQASHFSSTDAGV
jgi:hypothetical protein